MDKIIAGLGAVVVVAALLFGPQTTTVQVQQSCNLIQGTPSMYECPGTIQPVAHPPTYTRTSTDYSEALLGSLIGGVVLAVGVRAKR